MLSDNNHRLWSSYCAQPHCLLSTAHVPRIMPGPLGKMGKLRVREAEPSGKNESKVTQWQVVETELEPRRSRACALSSSALQPGVAWHFADPFGGKKTPESGASQPQGPVPPCGMEKLRHLGFLGLPESPLRKPRSVLGAARAPPRPRPEAELGARPPGAREGKKNEFSCRPVAVSIDRTRAGAARRAGGLPRSCRRTIIGKKLGRLLR